MRGQEATTQGARTYRSCIFFLTADGQVHPVPQVRYVAIVRGEEALPQLAGRRVRLADWYVAVRDGEIIRIENETYGFLEFDAQGYACPPCGGESRQPKRWEPSQEERAHMIQLLPTHCAAEPGTSAPP